MTSRLDGTLSGVGPWLRHVLSLKGWTQKDLAWVIGRPVQVVNEIAAGRKRVTAETAYQLESAGLMHADFWMDEQKREDLRGVSRLKHREIQFRARQMGGIGR